VPGNEVDGQIVYFFTLLTGTCGTSQQRLTNNAVEYFPAVAIPRKADRISGVMSIRDTPISVGHVVLAALWLKEKRSTNAGTHRQADKRDFSL
jgi:hypothetical protein